MHLGRLHTKVKIMTVEVVNFGCRLNIYEGEAIKASSIKAGLTDTVVFNSCAVTAEAERQLRQSIRKTRRARPQAKLIVTGCAAQISPEKYAQMDEVDGVLGNSEKMSQTAYSDWISGDEKAIVNDIFSIKETASHMLPSLEGHSRAFVQVQNGCDHRCTFCIIPFGRGNSRSVPIGDIVQQCRKLTENGYQEMVLTGVDISDYGKELPGAPTLGQMIRRLLAAVPAITRLRLSSIDAVEVDDDLYQLIGDEPRLMPHLHISIQAGDDMILKRMKRRHLREDIVHFCEKVRAIRPDMVFGADIIAGFPTETDAMFDNTLNLVDEAGLTYLHVFPYSAREGTPAAKMPQVPMPMRKERAARLREKGKAREAAYYQSLVGQTMRVLTEEGNKGRTEHYALVHFEEEVAAGQLLDCSITQLDGQTLYAVACD